MMKLPWLMAFSSDPCFRFLVAVLTLTTKMDINSSLSYIRGSSFDGEAMNCATGSNSLSFDILLFLVRHSAVQNALVITCHSLIP